MHNIYGGLPVNLLIVEYVVLLIELKLFRNTLTVEPLLDFGEIYINFIVSSASNVIHRKSEISYTDWNEYEHEKVPA